MKGTLHLLGLPHTHPTADFSACAYTGKILRMGKMMRAQGWRVVVYWGDVEGVECDEHVVTFTTEEQERWYGKIDPRQAAQIADFDATAEAWRTMNGRAAEEIIERWTPGEDLLLVTAGLAQQEVEQKLVAARPRMVACEPGCGYTGWYLPFVAFESHAWRHWCYGNRAIDNGRWFDAVIPNYFDTAEWPMAHLDTDDYLLFMGRMIDRKGVRVAAMIAQELGLPLVFMGQGVVAATGERILCTDGTVIEGTQLEYVGTLTGRERAAFVRGARALIAPTTYIEPFGGVAVEAQLCGVPAVTSDWGAFTETVEERFRFRTLAEGVEAVGRAMELTLDERVALRRAAQERWGLEPVGRQFDLWFEQLLSLYGAGWYEGTAAAAAWGELRG